MAKDDTLLTDTDDTNADDSTDDDALDLLTVEDTDKVDKDDDADDKDGGDDDDKDDADAKDDSDDDSADSDDDKADDKADDDKDGDDKKDDDKKDDDKKDDKDDTDSEDIEIDIPEGGQVDAENLDKFVALAKDLGLNKKQAQKIFDLNVEFAKAETVRFEADRAEWLKTIKSDEDFGMDNFEKSKELAKRAMKRFANDELKGLLDATGFGDHPDVFKLMVNVGRAMGEAEFFDGKGNLGDEDRDTADVLFGDMTGKK